MSTTTTTVVPDVASDNPSFVLQEPHKVTFENRPIPTLGPHDVLVAVKTTGICGSDVHYYVDGHVGDFYLRAPMVLGHESAGVVAGVGNRVTTLQTGDKVAVEPGTPCRRCNRCKEGQYNLCKEVIFAASPPHDGTLSKYYSVPADFCYKLPSHVSMEEGALMEPLAVAVHIVRLAPITPGQDVVVFGAGPVGLLCMTVAKAFGAGRIVAVDLNDARLEFAASYAATTTVKPNPSESPYEAARRIKVEGGIEAGANVAIEATGAEPCARQAALVLGDGGVYVQGGMGKSEFNGWPIHQMLIKEAVMKTSFRYKQGDYELAVKLVSAGKVDVKPLISSIVPFEEAETAYKDTMAAKGIKILIRGPE
ncbi:MAG: hypothetical protein Q9159_006259 [Coniocarpon cinnabarinum]